MARLTGRRISQVVILVFLFALAGLGSSAHAAKTIYRCTKDGQITLTDKPCEGSPSPENSNATSSQSSSTTVASSSNLSPVGDWHGQIQYQGRENGQTLAEAHSVESSSLTFSADGKVSGASQEIGCKWLGVWSQGGRLVSIDPSLTGCAYDGLNRRFTGTFLLGVPDSSGEMMLQAFTLPLPGRGARLYDIKGTLRR